jgi:hypothetical protein
MKQVDLGDPPSTFIEDTQVRFVSLRSVTGSGNRNIHGCGGTLGG